MSFLWFFSSGFKQRLLITKKILIPYLMEVAYMPMNKIIVWILAWDINVRKKYYFSVKNEGWIEVYLKIYQVAFYQRIWVLIYKSYGIMYRESKAAWPFEKCKTCFSTSYNNVFIFQVWVLIYLNISMWVWVLIYLKISMWLEVSS